MDNMLLKSIENSLFLFLEGKNDSIFFVFDSHNESLAFSFKKYCTENEILFEYVILNPNERPYNLVPFEVLYRISIAKPTVCFNFLKLRKDEIPFRVELLREEARRNCKIAHILDLNDMSFRKYMSGSISNLANNLRTLRDHLNLKDFSFLKVTAPSGTNLEIRIENRTWYSEVDPIIGTPINLPFGEIYIAPVEDSVNGVLAIDVAIGGLGKVSEPTYIEIEHGRAIKVEGFMKNELEEVLFGDSSDKQSNLIGEFAFGLNKDVPEDEKLFLLLEKAYGNAHLAFGSNEDFGGLNLSKIHIDLIFAKPTIISNGVTIFLEGELMLSI